VASAAAVLAAVLAVAAPAAAADREHQQIMADLRMLQEQTQQLQVSLNAITEALKAVSGGLDQQGNAMRKALADQRLLIETLTADVRVVREKLDETNVRVSSLSQELEALRQSMIAPPPAPAPPEEGLPSETDPDAPPTTAPAPAPAPAPSVAGLSPQRLYDTAYADYTAGQFSLAIQGFETYLKTFPRTEQADDAQANIGEAYMLDGKPEQAVAAYDRLIANYPNGDRNLIAMAYYKRGLALARLKQDDRARESWQTAIQKFPDSDAARLAKQSLDRLPKKDTPPKK
jgi:TolA-binding protein